MKKVIAGCLFIVSAMTVHAQTNATYELRVRNYIEQYKGLACAEQQRCGIPAAITLAQGIHETSAGNSELATLANNHFGIKCKKEWQGETFAHTDDAPNECFRKYPSSDHSYKDHSDYLLKSPRYAELFKLSTTDYAGWAMGLKRCGYATNPRYAQVLIKLIEDYRLQEYTYAAMENKEDFGAKYAANVSVAPKAEVNGSRYATKDEIVPENDAPETASTPAAAAAATAVPATAVAASPKVVTPFTPKADNGNKAAAPAYGQIVKVNGLKAIYARKGYTPLEYAYKADIRYAKLLAINEIDERPLPHDMYLYLEKKSTKGVRPTHVVKPGETLFAISQIEGVQMKSLMEMNLLQGSEEPVPGSILQLQKVTSEKPVVSTKKPNTTNIAVNNAPAIAAPAASTPAIAGTPAANAPARQAANKNIKVTNDYQEPATTIDNVPVTVELTAEEVTPAVVNEPITEQQAPAIIDPTKEEESSIVKTADIKETVAETPVVATQAPAPKKEAVAETLTFSAPMQSTTSVMASMPQVSNAETKPVEVKESKPVAITKQEEEEPTDELDKLKKQFDRVVYKKQNNISTANAAPVEETRPVVTASAPTTPVAVQANSAESEKFYTVKKGDTGFSIAKRNGITVKQLTEWNNLNFGAIKEGQKLRVKQ